MKTRTLIFTGFVLAGGLAVAGCHKPTYSRAVSAAEKPAGKICQQLTEPKIWTVGQDAYLIEYSCVPGVPSSRRARKKLKVGKLRYFCKAGECSLHKGGSPADATPVAVAPALPKEEEAPPEAESATEVGEPDPALSSLEAEIRSALDANAEDIVTCAGTEKVLVRVALKDGAASLTLAGELAGSPEEGCVRAVVGELAAPAELSHELLHIVRVPQVSATATE